MHSLPELNSIAEAITQRQRLIITSHARPDGDSIGSELALAHALKSLQKDVRVINRDPGPSYLASFPGTSDIEICQTIEHTFDAAIVLECPSLERTGVTGLDRSFVINIDHHLGNMGYGDLNWVDETAAACGEMVFDLVTTLGVRLTPSITTHLYVAILTDTGSFRHSNITAKTFRICAALAQTGITPPAIADRIFQNGTVGKLRLTGTLLDTMDLANGGHTAVLNVDDEILRSNACTTDDLEGLINLPLAAQSIKAVIMFKTVDNQLRVSLRSKGSVDVRVIATRHGGGGHKNAAGFSITKPTNDIRTLIVAEVKSSVENTAF
jgi:phosphoesterase RecJ-like protein